MFQAAVALHRDYSMLYILRMENYLQGTNTIQPHKIYFLIDFRTVQEIMIATADMNHTSTVDKIIIPNDLRKGRNSNKMMRDLWGLKSSNHRRPTIANGSIAKTYWPELVGRKVDEATQLIIRNQPYLIIEKVGFDHTDDLTLEYHAQRVQLFVDDMNVIIYAPQIG